MKHLLRFVAGGLVYYLVEVVWRFFMNHGTASPLMMPMGGLVFLVVMLAEDKHLPIWLGSLLGGATAVLCELAVGSVLLFGFGIRLWHYGRINWNGIIALDWSLIWCGVCFGLIVARRLIEHILKRRAEKKREE